MTEKNYNPEQKTAKAMTKHETVHPHQHQHSETHHHGTENKTEENENQGSEPYEKKETTAKQKESKPEKISQVKERPKRTNAVVNGVNSPISTKHSAAICRFIKRKSIREAIKDLEQVARIKKPVPMKGEIPHRKGKIMSGRFPEKAAKEFIVLLKSLSTNSIYNGLENPIIVEAVANIGARPFGRHGVRRKRTHVRIVAEEKQNQGSAPPGKKNAGEKK